MLNTEMFVASNKAQLDVLAGLTSRAFEGLEKITALNLQVLKTGLAEAAETGRAALSATDAQALFALQAGVLQPAADKVAAYGRQVHAIVTATGADFEKVAAEQFSGAQSQLLSAVESLAKNAPEGSTGGLVLVKSAFAAANNAFDGLQKAGKQASNAAEASYSAFSGAVAKPAKTKRA
jgi:phasin family protein